MKRLRNLVLGVVTCVALMAPLASPPAASAENLQPSSHGNFQVFWVYYRANPNVPWVCYGGYYQEAQAVQAINYFRYYGYDTFYR